MAPDALSPSAEWYYAEAGKERGPHDTATMLRLHAEGTIHDTTKVWREGLEDWTLFRETALGFSAGSGPAPAGDKLPAGGPPPLQPTHTPPPQAGPAHAAFGAAPGYAPAPGYGAGPAPAGGPFGRLIAQPIDAGLMVVHGVLSFFCGMPWGLITMHSTLGAQEQIAGERSGFRSAFWWTIIPAVAAPFLLFFGLTMFLFAAAPVMGPQTVIHTQPGPGGEMKAITVTSEPGNAVAAGSFLLIGGLALFVLFMGWNAVRQALRTRDAAARATHQHHAMTSGGTMLALFVFGIFFQPLMVVLSVLWCRDHNAIVNAANGTRAY